MTTWQIYGPQETEGSWCRVAAGLVEGLEACGERVSFFPTDSLGHDLDRPLPDGFDAGVGIFVGPPAHARMMRGQGNHQERWLMLAPNSTWLPRDVLAELKRNESVTGYLTPSAWGKVVLERYTALPVRVWQHGVTHGVRRGALMHHQRESGRSVGVRPPHLWKCLHLSSSQAGRKSTHELVRAFVEFAESPGIWPEVNPQLTVLVDGPVGDVEAVRDAAATTVLGRQCVIVKPRGDLSPCWVGDMMAAHDCVVQPSRSEGFGMVPLEARVAGVPVIMTDGTGHLDHVPEHTALHGGCRTFEGGYVTQHGVCVIEVGAFAPIDDGPDGRAPTVPSTSIVSALHAACGTRHRLAVWAAARGSYVLREWSWRAVTAHFLGKPR